MKFTTILILIFAGSLFFSGHAKAIKTCFHIKDGVREILPYATIPSSLPCPHPTNHDCNGNIMPPPGGYQSCPTDDSAASNKLYSKALTKPIGIHPKNCSSCHNCQYLEVDGGPE